MKSGSRATISRRLYDTLREAGEAFSLRLFGLRALNALRVEKSFGSWAREYRPVYNPYEAGLGRFVDLHKGSFIGSGSGSRGQRAPL